LRARFEYHLPISPQLSKLWSCPSGGTREIASGPEIACQGGIWRTCCAILVFLSRGGEPDKSGVVPSPWCGGCCMTQRPAPSSRHCRIQRPVDRRKVQDHSRALLSSLFLRSRLYRPGGSGTLIQRPCLQACLSAAYRVSAAAPRLLHYACSSHRRSGQPHYEPGCSALCPACAAPAGTTVKGDSSSPASALPEGDEGVGGFGDFRRAQARSCTAPCNYT